VHGLLARGVESDPGTPRNQARGPKGDGEGWGTGGIAMSSRPPSSAVCIDDLLA
jgi:hypothetical protein